MVHILIYPLDKYENEPDNVESEYLEKLEVYFDVYREGKYEITSTGKLVERNSNSFDLEVEGGTCSSSESKIIIKLNMKLRFQTLVESNLMCYFHQKKNYLFSCIVPVIANNLDFIQTKNSLY